MPTLCRPVAEGGVGFDYRLGMGTPDLWVKLVKEQRDEDWSMSALVSSLCNRRRSERTVGYVESHDQSLVGDQTLGDALPSPSSSTVFTFSAAHQSQKCTPKASQNLDSGSDHREQSLRCNMKMARGGHDSRCSVCSVASHGR